MAKITLNGPPSEDLNMSCGLHLLRGGWVLLTCVLAFCLGGCIHGPYSSTGRVVIQDDHALIDIVFSDHDRALIREHYGFKHKAKHKPLPPGLAKKNKLPPGIQRQLTRQSKLPAGLQHQRLPRELERQLSHIPDGYIRIMVGGIFVLFNEHTRVIFDIIHEQ